MQIIVNGRNIEITPAIKAYVKEKMAKVVEHYDQLIDFEVILTVIKTDVLSGFCFKEYMFFMPAHYRYLDQ